MSRWISASAAVVVLGLLAPAQGIAESHATTEGGPAFEKKVNDAAVQVGGEYYQLYCAVCHGDDGKGGGEYASLLTVAPPDLTKIASRRDGKFPGDEVARIIQGLGGVRAHGPKVMPGWDTVFAPEKKGSEKEAGGKAVLLTEYLRSIQKK